MKNNRRIILIRKALVRLLLLLVISVLSIIISTTLINGGHISLDYDPSIYLSAIVVIVCGIICKWLLRDKNAVSYLAAVAAFYLLIMFAGVVVFEGNFVRLLIASLFGGVGALLGAISIAVTKKRSHKWNRKKFNC